MSVFFVDDSDNVPDGVLALQNVPGRDESDVVHVLDLRAARRRAGRDDDRVRGLGQHQLEVGFRV